MYDVRFEETFEQAIQRNVICSYRTSAFANSVKNAVFHLVEGEPDVVVKLSNYDNDVRDVIIKVWANYTPKLNAMQNAKIIANEIEKKLKPLIKM